MPYKDRQTYLQYQKEWKIRNPKRCQWLARRREQELRMKVFNLLGGYKCVQCGFDDFRALQLDHINGSGSKDRNNFSHVRVFYKYYIDNPELAKRTLQVLCANCNWIKREKLGENR